MICLMNVDEKEFDEWLESGDHEYEKVRAEWVRQSSTTLVNCSTGTVEDRIMSLTVVWSYAEPGKRLVWKVKSTFGEGEDEPSKVTSGISLLNNTKLSPAPIDIWLLSI